MLQLAEGADLILAEGEKTGHFHELNSGKLYESKGTLYFSASGKETILNHPEYGAITFELGIYRVIHQREYTPRIPRVIGD